MGCGTAEGRGGEDVFGDAVAYHEDFGGEDFSGRGFGGEGVEGLDAEAEDGGVGLADAYRGAVDDGAEQVGDAEVGEDSGEVAVEVGDYDEGVAGGECLEHRTGFEDTFTGAFVATCGYSQYGGVGCFGSVEAG